MAITTKWLRLQVYGSSVAPGTCETSQVLRAYNSVVFLVRAAQLRLLDFVFVFFWWGGGGGGGLVMACNDYSTHINRWSKNRRSLN